MAVENKKRMANLELLRCLAMMMVVVLHFLGKGNLLGDVAAGQMDGVGIFSWVLESFCIVAVNVYMLISGYFLSTSSFKLSRLIRLWLQVWFYSVGVGLLAVVCGMIPMSEVGTNYFIQLLFPISMGHYWFLTAYVFLYILLPLLTMAVKNMTKQQMQVTVILLLLTFSIIKSVVPVRLDMDGKGYDCLWYVCVFLVAAYLRRFGFPFLEKKGRGLCLYVIGCIAIFAELWCLHLVYVQTGSLGYILTVSMEYNHVLPLLASVGLFAAFLRVNISGKLADVVRRIAPYTLGVYLLHENVGVRTVWQNWFGADGVSSVGELILRTLAAVAVVFVVGILMDFLRSLLMGVAHKGLLHWSFYEKVVNRVQRVDSYFSEK